MSAKDWVTLLVPAYMLLTSLVCFVLMGMDKRRAHRGKWRIPEATLLLVALLGGAAGGLAGMFIFRHKTKHAKFKILLPLFFVLNLLALLVVV